MLMGFGLNIPNWRTGGGVSAAAAFLATNGPHGMVLDFADASIAIDDAANLLDLQSQGQVSGGALVGPGAKLTNTAPSLKLTEQADGNLGFQAHNLILQSETFTSASWFKFGVSAPDASTLQASATTALHYATQAYASAIGGAPYVASIEMKMGTHRYASLQMSDGTSGVGRLVDLQDGTILAALTIGSTMPVVGTPTLVSVGDGWYRLEIGFRHGTASANLSVSPFIRVDGVNTIWGAAWAAEGTETIQVRKVHLRRTPSASDYIKTTTAAVYDLPYVYSSGVRTGIFPEPAATNLCLYATDLTQGSGTGGITSRTGWNAAVNATAAKTAIGPDNVANSASTLTATASNGSILQHFTSASAVRTGSVYLKRRTGTGAVTVAIGETTGSNLVVNGDFSSDTVWSKGTGWTIAAGVATRDSTAGASNLTQSGILTAGKFYRLTWTQPATTAAVAVYGGSLSTLLFNTTGAGTYTINFMATGTDIIFRANGVVESIDAVSCLEVAETTVDLSSGGWIRASIENKTITNPCVAVKLATSGDAVDVYCAQLEPGTNATSPIITYGSAVLRAADNDTIATALFPYSASTGTLLVEYVTSTTALGTAVAFFDTAGSDANLMLLYGQSGTGSAQLLSYDGSGVNQVNLTRTVNGANTLNKVAFAYAANDFALCANGGTVSTDTSATLPTPTTLRVGGNRNVNQQLNGIIKRIAYFPERKTNAAIEAMTA